MDVMIELTFKGKKSRETLFTSEMLKAEDALALSYELAKIGNVKQMHFIDEKNTHLKQKDLAKLLAEIKEEPHDIVAYFDGGYDKETGAAGIGIVVYYTINNKRYRIRKNALLQELNSNNEAEYAALWNVITHLEQIGVKHNKIHIKGDSQVVIQQASGEWAVYEQEFITWLDRIDHKLAALGLDIQYELIERRENKEADKLATQALEGVFIESEIEMKN